MYTYNVQVVHSLGPPWLVRKSDLFVGSSKKFSVAPRSVPPPLVPCLEVFQLNPQDSGLNRVQPAVVSFHFVIIFPRLAVIAQHLDEAREALVIRYNRPTLTTSSEVLSRIKTKGGGLPH